MARLTDDQVRKKYCAKQGEDCEGCPSTFRDGWSCYLSQAPEFLDLRTVNRITREMRRELEARP